MKVQLYLLHENDGVNKYESWKLFREKIFLKKVNSCILNKKRELNIQMKNGEVISDWYDFSFLLWESGYIWYNV